MFSARRTRLICLAFGLLPLLASCGLFSGAKDEPQQVYANADVEMKEIKVAVLPTLDVAPFHIALKDEFAKEGLKVTPVAITQGGQGVDMLAADAVNIAFGSYTPFFLAESRGILNHKGGLRLVADATSLDPKNSQIIVASGSPINTPADLRGKKIAVAGLRTMTWVLTVAALELHDIDPSAVDFVEMPFPNTGAAVANHQVDAAFLTEPFLTQSMMEFGVRSIWDTDGGNTSDLPLTGYAATGEFVKNNPKTLAAFQRAMQRATATAADDRPLVQELLPKYSKVDPETAQIMGFTRFNSGLLKPQLERVVDLMADFGMFRDTATGQDLVENVDLNRMIARPAPTTG